MNYERPRTRLRTAIMGAVAGDQFGDTRVVENLKDNLSFRLETAREMLNGNTETDATSPIQRRMEIRKRRLSAIGMKDSDGSDSINTSGSIGQSSLESMATSASTDSVDASVENMSQVDRGTKERAHDRGFR